ncbi:MAG: ethanolamine utilization protein EutH [Hespellia sp.]|nr:ethanolamine utilization protein EutH [Hespellia sp.]
MSFSNIVIYIMVGFMLLGGIDRIFGNKLGLGKEFEEGFHALGPLALGMVGITSLAPILGKVLASAVGPVFELFGADVSMSASILLPIDTGCYPLAHSMTQNSVMADFSSIIVASMLGCTIVFSIPVSLGIIKKEDTKFLAIGTLSGLIAIPLASMIGGCVMGIPIGTVLINLIPIILFSLILTVLLLFLPEATIKGFAVFAKIVVAIITLGLMLAIFQELTGITLVEDMTPLSESFAILGSIAVMLAGAYPFVFVITKVLAKPLGKMGSLLKINETAAGGMLATLANSVPMLMMIKQMDDRGKTLNFAFACCAAFTLGDHLGFASSMAPHMIMPMIIAKLSGGIMAVCIANVIYNRIYKKAKA